jgi:hypothetical protein
MSKFTTTGFDNNPTSISCQDKTLKSREPLNEKLSRKTEKALFEVKK